MKKVKILGVQFDVCTKNEALARVIGALKNRQNEPGKQIATPNPEMLLQAQENHEFKDALNKAWLNIPDGAGILWASTFQEIAKRDSGFLRHAKALLSLASLAVYPRFCRKIFSERLTGVDLMESLCAVSAPLRIPVFLLGAKPGVAEKAKEVLIKRYPGLHVSGLFSGSPSEYDFPAIQAAIAETRPQILFVAYGSPNQELWIAKHLHELESVKIAMGVGGAFDFLAGLRLRAPKWMQKLGIEWAYRLIQEPKRLKRIWNATVKFPTAIIKSR